MRRTRLYITGTDTGVGKTVLTVLLARHLRERGVNAAVLKPVSTGGRDDAQMFHALMDGALTLDEINPWYFNAPIAPALAARRENRRVTRRNVLAYIRAMQKRFPAILIEGAGGLFSPLGENFDSRDLIVALRATPIIVCPNRLGAVNQVLLSIHALPRRTAWHARVVLMSPPKPDSATGTNAGLLARFLGAGKIFQMPWLGSRFDTTQIMKNSRLWWTLHALAHT